MRIVEKLLYGIGGLLALILLFIEIGRASCRERV